MKIVESSSITFKFANYLFGKSELPEEILTCIFNMTIDRLEKREIPSLEFSMKEKIWNSVSENMLKILQKTYFIEGCYKILLKFKESKILGMVREYDQTGSIKNIDYINALRFKYYCIEKSIIQTLHKKASSLKRRWIQEIVEAVKNEGIKFFEPKAVEVVEYDTSTLKIVLPLMVKPDKLKNFSLSCVMN